MGECLEGLRADKTSPVSSQTHGMYAGAPWDGTVPQKSKALTNRSTLALKLMSLPMFGHPCICF